MSSLDAVSLRAAIRASWLVCALALTAASLTGCFFDRSGLDERSCDPSDPFSCAEGICSPEGYCVSQGIEDFLVTTDDVVEDLDGTEPDAALPCGGCPAGESCCDDVCVSIRNNDDHCGACGVVCGESQVCAGAECACVVGRYDCDGAPGNGCETDLLTSEDFCGDCGDGMGSSACFTERFACTGGVCTCGDTPCAAGQDCCGGSCVDTGSSPNNCGACGVTCGAGEVCSAGSCVCGMGPACAMGQQCCKGNCIDPNVTVCDCGGNACSDTCCDEAAGAQVCVTLTDTDAHCGGCGQACAPGRTCSNGTCLCAAGTLECAGACVDIDSDARNCGDCDRDCTAFDNVSAATCSAGACQLQCADGFADCDGNPTNGCEVETATDPLNCGACADPMMPVTCFDLPFVDEAACTAGACTVTTCIADRGDCDAMAAGCETDLTGDDANCGSCGTSCALAAGQNEVASCVDSICETSCAAGWLDCDGLPGCEVQGTSCRVTNGLIALHTFTENSGTTASDSSGFPGTLDLERYNDANEFEWISGRNGVRFTGDSGMRATSGQSVRIKDQCNPSDNITVEAWIIPANTSQGGPARIVTYSQDGGDRNFTLGQQGDRWAVRFRTAETSDNGTIDGNNPIQTAAGTVTTSLTHLVMTYDSSADRLVLYADTVEVGSASFGGGFNSWDSGYRYAVGNEVPSDTPRIWRGDMFMVAIYNRVLSAGEIAQNFSAGSMF